MSCATSRFVALHMPLDETVVCWLQGGSWDILQPLRQLLLHLSCIRFTCCGNPCLVTCVMALPTQYQHAKILNLIQEHLCVNMHEFS